jgi:hypothetical protein
VNTVHTTTRKSIMEIVYFIGLIFASTAIGYLSNISYGCLTFGVGLMLAAIVSNIEE